MIIPNSFSKPEELPNPIKTKKPNNDISYFWWSKNYQGELNAEQKEIKQLTPRLLSFGGAEVVLPLVEDDLHNILNRGIFLYGDKAKLKKGLPSQCHRNSCYLYEYENRNDFVIMTGYALSSDGLWRQHSWCYDGKNNIIIETTEKRVAYFGFVMTTKEADDFCFNCL